MGAHMIKRKKMYGAGERFMQQYISVVLSDSEQRLNGAVHISILPLLRVGIVHVPSAAVPLLVKSWLWLNRHSAWIRHYESNPTPTAHTETKNRFCLIWSSQNGIIAQFAQYNHLKKVSSNSFCFCSLILSSCVPTFPCLLSSKYSALFPPWHLVLSHSHYAPVLIPWPEFSPCKQFNVHVPLTLPFSTEHDLFNHHTTCHALTHTPEYTQNPVS